MSIPAATLRVVDGETGASAAEEVGTPGAVDWQRCRVVVVEPDPDVRARIGDGIPAADRAARTSDLELPRDRPVVVVLGPGAIDVSDLATLGEQVATHPLLAAVVVVDGLTTEVMQAAIRAGARDVVDLGSGPEAVNRAVARVADLLPSAVPGGPAGAGPATVGPGLRTPGRIVAVFSPKGGVGKTVVATNVAAALAASSPEPVALVDADLQYGDVAVVLGLPPDHSVVDAAGAAGADDPGVLRDLMTAHRSGLLILPAPREPMMGLALDPDDVHALCSDLRRLAGITVVDVPSVFDDATFALLENADEILLVASMDIPSIKNLKVGMQAFDLLGVAGPKLRLVLNRANAQVKLDPREIERVLGIPVAFPVPYDLAVPIAVNAGEPVVSQAPRSAAARAFSHIAGSLQGAEVDTSRRARRRR